jgi:hypothetical protein
MAGYTRQSVADIIANAVIKAAPVNAEFNAIRDAFNNSTGHKHDGTSAEGTYVPLIADLDGNNKVVVDTANNRVSFYSEVGGSAVEQVRIQDGAIVPVTNDDVDLGTASLKFKDLYVDGVGYLDDITVTGTSTFANIDINGGAIDGVTIGAASAGSATFTDVTATGTTTISTADINGGNIDATTIGATTPTAATFTDVTATGTTTVTTADINGGNIDGTVIGATTAVAGSFTTVSTSGQATLATVDINGGSIDGTIIGASTAAAITGTTITGTSLVGPLTGSVTGNVTGNVTGDVTGDLTGNVTASSGSSTFNNVVIDGTLNMNAGTTATIQNLTAPTNDLDAATKKYVDDEVAGLVDSAPGTLDTLNELAAALGDDADFSNTVTTSIATKLPLAGGTMTGAIAMGTSKITGLGDPTAAQDAASKNYSDTTFLGKAGGTMTGAIDMGSAKVTTTYTPTNGPDLTNKTYVDSIAGSGASAASSATAAASSATAAATSETNAGNSATAAASSATSAAASYDSFDDRYLGAKSSAPSVDNDGDALIAGALYFNTTTDIMYVYGGSGWQAAGSSVNGTSNRNTYTATAGQTAFASTYDPGFVDAYLNGVKLIDGTDFTATNGTSIVLASGAAVGDTLDIVAYGTFVVADTYTKTQADARYVEVAGDTVTGGLNVTGGNVGIGTSSPIEKLQVAGQLISTGSNSTGSTSGAERAIVDLTSNAARVGHFRGSSSSGSGKLELYTDSVKRVTINDEGRVGIGVTPHASSTGYSLQIGGTSQSFISIHNNTTGNTVNDGLTLGNDANNVYINNRENTPMLFSTNDTERMRIDSSGNLGLGRTDPADGKFGDGSSAFVTSGNGTAVGSTHFATNSDDSSFIGMWSGHSGAEPAIAVKNTKALTFGNWSNLNGAGGFTERMRIDSSGDVNIVNELKAGSYNETYAALSGTTPAVNCETGNVFAISTSGNTTFTFTNPPASGTAYGFTLKVTAGGTHTLTWPSSVDWAGGSAPDAPASGETNVLVFITYDGGTTWYGFQAGAALA